MYFSNWLFIQILTYLSFGHHSNINMNYVKTFNIQLFEKYYIKSFNFKMKTYLNVFWDQMQISLLHGCSKIHVYCDKCHYKLSFIDLCVVLSVVYWTYFIFRFLYLSKLIAWCIKWTKKQINTYNQILEC